MTETIDENGVTVVGNKVMVSGKLAAGGSNIMDMSPYMNVIEQVIVNEANQGDPMEVRNAADDDAFMISSVLLVEILSDTTFRTFQQGSFAPGTRTNQNVDGVFGVIGRK